MKYLTDFKASYLGLFFDMWESFYIKIQFLWQVKSYSDYQFLFEWTLVICGFPGICLFHLSYRTYWNEFVIHFNIYRICNDAISCIPDIGYCVFFSNQSSKRLINFTDILKESTFGFIVVLYCFCFLFLQFPPWSLLFPFSFYFGFLSLSFFSYVLDVEAEILIWNLSSLLR